MQISPESIRGLWAVLAPELGILAATGFRPRILAQKNEEHAERRVPSGSQFAVLAPPVASELDGLGQHRRKLIQVAAHHRHPQGTQARLL